MTHEVMVLLVSSRINLSLLGTEECEFYEDFNVMGLSVVDLATKPSF